MSSISTSTFAKHGVRGVPAAIAPPSNPLFSTVFTENVGVFRDTTLSPGRVSIRVDVIPAVAPAIGVSVLQTVLLVEPTEGFSYNIKKATSLDGAIVVTFDNGMGCKRTYKVVRKAGVADASSGGLPRCKP